MNTQSDSDTPITSGTPAGISNTGNGGALARLGGWQVFVIGLVIVLGGGFLLHAGSLPVWAYLLAIGVYFLGVGAVVTLLGALSDLRSHLCDELTNASSRHLSATLDAVQAAKSDARSTVQAHTAVVEKNCAAVLTELKTNTELTQQAASGVAALQVRKAARK
jgi:hypothetical protein